ncbi:bifunctional E2 E3 enzyme [Lecanosticta acicola]|uniref:peptidylprolyl isomerase n=1 Tax=Lecanosticta acicola TaxID=111012 RepID=A0AAI8YT58_9PEZI|nr:bifunctional E2 E3 enzyme [Lecanosticta acicola]
MARLRYTVTLVTPETSGQGPPKLAVPFEPSALVSAFVEEIFRRVQKQGIELQPNTHIATLHLDSETGAILDTEDLLSDVVTDPHTETLFAVFRPKGSTPSSHEAPPGNNSLPVRDDGAGPQSEHPHLSIRIITPDLAKQDKRTISPIKIPTTATVKQLHQAIADHLHLPYAFDNAGLDSECNCNLARELATGARSPKQLMVVHGKSIVQHLEVPENPPEVAISSVLNNFFDKCGDTKKVTYHGEEYYAAGQTHRTFKRIPVVALCSKKRHIPAHAASDYGSVHAHQSRLLDIHTSEMPISSACMDVKLTDLGLDTLADDGAVDIFAVNRSTTAFGAITGHGKAAIFRYQAHWEPVVKQSDRGMATLLSSLRVFASIVQDMSGDERHHQDAIYHVLSLLTSFPPALRAMHILVQGKTPNAVECAALSHAMFEVLSGFMPSEIIGTDGSRVFEGSRLLFGFILEKVRSIKLSEDLALESLPYLDSFDSHNIRDFKTGEPIMHLVSTSQGMIEKALFHALQEHGALRDSHLQSYLIQIDQEEHDSILPRAALLSGGMAGEVTGWSAKRLASSYHHYARAGATSNVFDLTELSELHHLAELCGRHKLAVHNPSQSVSAASPCLTFDRNGHVAVYTGQTPCSDPGKSSQIFRPKHGEETIDVAVVEQLLAPIIQTYESDGTTVFTAGGAAVRRQQAPDEIVMFAVDCSSSMRVPTDFADVNDEDPPGHGPDVHSLIEGYHYTRLNFDNMKERISAEESFEDMIAIIAEANSSRRRFVASEVVELLRITLGAQITKIHGELARRNGMYQGYPLSAQESSLDKLKTFWAGLRTHETALCDFLMFRATTSPDVNRKWMWSLGDGIPEGSESRQLPSLPDQLTEIPNHLVCPISHALMEDAVRAADGFSYSRQAISQWFAIRAASPTSPMTGLELNTTSVEMNGEISNLVASWIGGRDLLARQPSSSVLPNPTIKLNFSSRMGYFERKVLTQTNVNDLYRLVFRGLKARYAIFQLAKGERTIYPSTSTLHSEGFCHGDTITIRLADDADMVTAGPTTSTVSGEMCLIKVYRDISGPACSYWVRRDTTLSLRSILWKYWRSTFANDGMPVIEEHAVWTHMENNGDGLLSGWSNSCTDGLSQFLNRTACFGKLSPEPAYKEEQNDFSALAEATQPLVLKVYIHPPIESIERRDKMKFSRLDVLKQMFEALINRLLAYGFKSHVGLITFDTKARVAMSITHVLENLRRATVDMQADGDTALWDALALCQDQLKEYGLKYPNAKRRMIVISDGDDTKSTSNTAHGIAWKLKQDGIAVDSVLLGDDGNEELMALSHLLGCYKFQPTSLPNALAICELEPFLSVTERPTIRSLRNVPSDHISFRCSFKRATVTADETIVTADNFPARKQHPNMHDDMVQLSAFAMRTGRPSAAGSSRSNIRTLRLMNEMKTIVTSGGHSSVDIYISESDMSFWKIVMSGPEDSPYSEGTFLLYLHMDEDYPTFAPQCRMVTKIKHPNINPHGRVCHSLFGRDWTSDTSVRTVIDTIFGLLLQAEASDPVNTAAALGYHHDQVEYADEVREYVKKHAVKSRQEWNDELLGLREPRHGDQEIGDGEDQEEDEENCDDDMDLYAYSGEEDEAEDEEEFEGLEYDAYSNEEDEAEDEEEVEDDDDMTD